MNYNKFFATPIQNFTLENKVTLVKEYREALNDYTLEMLDRKCKIYPSTHPDRVQAIKDYKLVKTLY